MAKYDLKPGKVISEVAYIAGLYNCVWMGPGTLGIALTNLLLLEILACTGAREREASELFGQRVGSGMT